MKLTQQVINLITETAKLKIRRRFNELERILYNVLENMYVCDYKTKLHFVEGVEYEYHEFWNFGSVEVLDEFEWDDIQELIDNEFSELIRNYYNEYSQDCNKSNELTEYPNFVYESENKVNIPYAVFEITKPLAHMQPEYYYQEAPLWKTKESMIYVNKGSAGHKTISTNHIKVLEVFPEGETKEMYDYLEELRSKVR
jgi:hypothetical protein